MYASILVQHNSGIKLYTRRCTNLVSVYHRCQINRGWYAIFKHLPRANFTVWEEQPIHAEVCYGYGQKYSSYGPTSNSSAKSNTRYFRDATKKNAAILFNWSIAPADLGGETWSTDYGMVSTRSFLGYSVGHIKESGLLKEGMHSKLRGRAGHFLCVLVDSWRKMKYVFFWQKIY